MLSPENALDPSAPFANLALAAIGAAHQGVFDLDFRAQLLTLVRRRGADAGTACAESDPLAFRLAGAAPSRRSGDLSRCLDPVS